MTHFGIFCPPATGHIDPMAALGRALQERGHRVTLFALRDLEGKVAGEGIGYAPIGERRYPVGSLQPEIKRLGELQGMQGVRFSIAAGAALAAMLCDEGPVRAQETGIDVLLGDQNEAAAGTVAERLGLPFITVCTSLAFNREPAIPPPFTSWPYATNAAARARNRCAYWFVDRLVAPIQRVVNEYRTRWKLPRLRTPDDSFSRLAQLSQMTSAFDFPHAELPDCFHYVGPFSRADHHAVPFPFERLQDLPLVYASLGTLQTQNRNHFQSIVDACASLPVQLVLSLGRSAVPAPSFRPESAIVVEYAPQLAVLSRAALTVTHAGTNTTMGSLSCGVPLVAFPITNDQPGMAARLQRTGAGETRPLSTLTERSLRTLIEKVLADPRYRRAALLQRDAIDRAGGVDRACAIIETVARTGRPVMRGPDFVATSTATAAHAF